MTKWIRFREQEGQSILLGIVREACTLETQSGRPAGSLVSVGSGTRRHLERWGEAVEEPVLLRIAGLQLTLYGLRTVGGRIAIDGLDLAVDPGGVLLAVGGGADLLARGQLVGAEAAVPAVVEAVAGPLLWVRTLGGPLPFQVGERVTFACHIALDRMEAVRTRRPRPDEDPPSALLLQVYQIADGKVCLGAVDGAASHGLWRLWFKQLAQVDAVVLTDPQEALATLRGGLTARLPGVVAVMASHQEDFVAAQLDLLRREQGGAFVTPAGPVQFTVALAELRPGCWLLHGLSRRGEGQPGAALAARRADLLLAVALYLQAHPGQWLVGWATRQEPFVALLVGLLARGEAVGGPAPVCQPVRFHHVEVRRAAAQPLPGGMAVQAQAWPPGWLVEQIAAAAADQLPRGRMAQIIGLDAASLPGEVSQRRWWVLQADGRDLAVLVLEVAPRGLSAFGLGDRASIFFTVDGLGHPDRSALLLRLFGDPALCAALLREGRPGLSLFDEGEIGPAMPDAICVEGRAEREVEESSFYFALPAQIMALFFHWALAITQGGPPAV